MRLLKTHAVPLSLLSTTLMACGGEDPPSPDVVRAGLRDDLAHVLREGNAATEAGASLPSGGAFGFAAMALGGADSAAARTILPLAQRFETKDRNLSLDEGEEGFDTDAIVAELEQTLFTNANYLGNGVYRVPADLVCKETTYDDTTGSSTTSIDPECALRLDQAQLRVRVAGDDDELRFHIQVDANHDEPLSFLLSHDELAITVDLDDASAAMIALAQIYGEPAPNADFSGQVTGSVKILGTAHARLALSFDRAIALAFAEDGQSLNGPGAYRFTSAAGEVFGIELDGVAARGDFDLGIGETTVHLPGDEFDPSTDIVLGGATVNASFQGETLTLENLSLGTKTTKVSYDGVQALAIDLNPNDGRSLNATITADPATGDETLSVSPRLDLHASVDHAALGDEPEVYDVTRVQIEGSMRGNELTGQTEILSGSVTLTTNPSQYGFTASAGQCVLATEVVDDITYTSYTQYSVGACQ